MASKLSTSFGSGSCADDQTNRMILPSENAYDYDACDRDLEDSGDLNQAYQLIWDRFRGLPAREAYPTLFLRDQQGYTNLCEKFSKHNGLLLYFNEPVRKDWNAKTGILTLRLIPTPLHEYFQESLIDAIKKELDRIVGEHPLLRPFRNSIKSGAHSDYGNSAAGFIKSPDGQFSYDGISYPQVVIEVAYSEGEKKAMNKSREYFTEKPGEISAVLLIDIHDALKRKRRAQSYSHSGQLSLWTSREEEDVVTVQRAVNAGVFRNHGQTSIGELVLPFELFIPPDRRHTLPVQNVALHLSYEMLSDFVTNAEERQRLADATPPRSSRGRRGRRVRLIDEHGDAMSEESFDAKRRRGSYQSDISTRRTRSMSQPRRSTRLRSTSNNKATEF
ncbi:hypothetical protein GGS24DRAFT_441915 [Hypoxylon argillaceum]|nr:hypothetical protein GGS24DRAFT_441915 [Hypoxylon argillaceum]